MKCFSVYHFYLVTSISSFRQFQETLWSILKVFLKVQTKARWSIANLLGGRSLGSGRRLGLDLGGLVAAAAATAAVEALLLHWLQLLVRGREQFLEQEIPFSNSSFRMESRQLIRFIKSSRTFDTREKDRYGQIRKTRVTTTWGAADTNNPWTKDFRINDDQDTR